MRKGHARSKTCPFSSSLLHITQPGLGRLSGDVRGHHRLFETQTVSLDCLLHPGGAQQERLLSAKGDWLIAQHLYIHLLLIKVASSCHQFRIRESWFEASVGF